MMFILLQYGLSSPLSRTLPGRRRSRSDEVDREDFPGDRQVYDPSDGDLFFTYINGYQSFLYM